MIWAVIPAKGFERGKSRLAGALGEERSAFARALFEHVLTTALACDAISRALVATDSEEVAALARARGAIVQMDSGTSGLAAVVDRALGRVEADAAIVLMADLPLIAVADVAEIARLLETHDVVVAPDRSARYTNALGLAPPTAMATAFGGGDSFRAHRTAAAGLRLAVLDNPRIALDVDDPADLAALRGSL